MMAETGILLSEQLMNIRKSITLMLSVPGDINSHFNVAKLSDRCFCCFLPPCWCPSEWAQAWPLQTKLYKFGQNISPDISHMKYCSDLTRVYAHLPPFISLILAFIY